MDSNISESSSATVHGTGHLKTNKTRRTRWNSDGPNDSVSSLSVLLEWLTAHGNYDRWRGGDKQSGESKSVLASQIVTWIMDSGVTTVRKPKDIISKIGQLEQSYRDAVDFLSNTGSGITNEQTLREAIEKRCPHYEALKDVLGDRPSARPLLTNEDVDFANDYDEDPKCDSAEWDEVELDMEQLTPLAKRRKQSNGSAKRCASIRPSSSSVSSTMSEWSDLNSTLSQARAKELSSNKQMHEDNMELKRIQFRQTTMLEERRLVCAEEETKCRVQLLQAQMANE